VVAKVLLGLGGNLGDPALTISSALTRLEQFGLRITRRSALYSTPPWGVADQPGFINACALAETKLSPRAVLAAALTVETELGRVREVRWGPRTIDIDILAYDDVTLDEPDLALPHPRLTERAFVLLPLAEVAPDHLIAGRTVRAWADLADARGIERLARAG
jgi:2-amino-4-hydroxy-6-hydroxymethyldihydropteridine diphosphokinase